MLKAGLKGIHSSLFAESGYVEARHLLDSSFKTARLRVASYTLGVLLHRMQVLILWKAAELLSSPDITDIATSGHQESAASQHLPSLHCPPASPPHALWSILFQSYLSLVNGTIQPASAHISTGVWPLVLRKVSSSGKGTVLLMTLQ